MYSVGVVGRALTSCSLPAPRRLSCLAVALALLRHCVTMYSALPSFHTVVRPLRALLAEHQAERSHPPELQVGLVVARAPCPGAMSEGLIATSTCFTPSCVSLPLRSSCSAWILGDQKG